MHPRCRATHGTRRVEPVSVRRSTPVSIISGACHLLAPIERQNMNSCLCWRDEMQRLQQWKREATLVLDEWEAVWDAAGRPGRPGESKAVAVRRLLEMRARQSP